MQFATSHPNCELFLTSRGVGFLMLSSSGRSLRKWQGLTVVDISIFAGIRWLFSHGEGDDSEILDEHNWLNCTRDKQSITRSWQARCGCRVHERWQWPLSSSDLTVSLKIEEQNHCTQAEKYDAVVKAVPLWTLTFAGWSSAGDVNASLAHLPPDFGILNIHAAALALSVNAQCRTLRAKDKTTSQGHWQWLPVPERMTISTPKDAERGEQGYREVLTTHQFAAHLKGGDEAQLLFSFKNDETSPLTFPSDPVCETLHFEGQDKNLSVAFANAAESLDQLIRIRTDGTVGLQAGLPWFTQFWTRDLCHSFRAAFLWSGRVKLGESILAHLWKNARDGGIPNYTTTAATTHNSIDALPLLLLSTADYIDFAGFNSPITEALPDIMRCLEQGSRVFSQGELMRHGPADTWMDAQKHGPGGELFACSPRADRAFEIQAFWVAALHRWAGLLQQLNDPERAKNLRLAAETGIQSIRKNYLNKDGRRWADTLRPDNSADFSLRPNLLLGWSALLRAGCLDKLLSAEELNKSLSYLIEKDLIVPYGIRTLSPESAVRYPVDINTLYEDESAYIHSNKIHFHPYHEFASRSGLEHPDWAYHNGTIWPWLSCSACRILLHSHLEKPAQHLRDTLVYHATQGEAGGAIPELLDGVSSHSLWSWPKGAPHQAWSEAALVHAVVEGWLGLNWSEFGQCLEIDTALWQSLGDFEITFPAASGRIFLKRKEQECSLLWLAKTDLRDRNFRIRNSKIQGCTPQSYPLKHNQPVDLKQLLS